MRKTRISRSGSLCATAGLILCGMAAQATAANLLGNPGFEQGPTGSPDNSIPNWTLTGSMQRAPFHNHTGGSNTSPAPDNNPGKSMWLKTFADTLGGGGGGEVSQIATGLTAGGSYLFSGWNFFESNYNNTNTNIITNTVTWFDAGGAQIGQPIVAVTYNPGGFGPNPDPNEPPGPGNVTPLPAPSTGNWIQFSMNLSAPAGATKAKVAGAYTGGTNGGGGISAFLDDMIFDGPGNLPTPIGNDWVPTTSGDWNSINNWASTVIPNDIGASANFLGTITASRTVYSDLPVTVGTINFNNANQYVIAGSGSLTVDVLAGTGAINVLQGSQKINLPTRLNDTTVATVAAGATLTIADPLTLANGSSLTKAGTGTLEIISTVTTLSPGLSTISTSAGTTNLRFQMAGGTGLANSGTGVTRTFTTQRVSSVNVTGGTVAIDSDGAAKVLVTDALTLTGSSKLDVGDNGMIVRGGNAATIRTAIATGRAGVTGIVTTASPANRGVGYATSAQLGNPASFMGEAFTGAAVLVRYTLLGDANLGGSVEFQDLVSLAQNYNGASKEWFQGDFDYDGDVDFADLIPLAQNYNGSVLDGGELAALGGGDFAADWALAQSLVPEPTTLSALGALATVALRRRR
jgi:hypothetical protein